MPILEATLCISLQKFCTVILIFSGKKIAHLVKLTAVKTLVVAARFHSPFGPTTSLFPLAKNKVSEGKTRATKGKVSLLISIPQSVMSLWASGLDLIRLMNLSMVFARAG